MATFPTAQAKQLLGQSGALRLRVTGRKRLPWRRPRRATQSDHGTREPLCLPGLTNWWHKVCVVYRRCWDDSGSVMSRPSAGGLPVTILSANRCGATGQPRSRLSLREPKLRQRANGRNCPRLLVPFILVSPISPYVVHECQSGASLPPRCLLTHPLSPFPPPPCTANPTAPCTPSFQASLACSFPSPSRTTTSRDVGQASPSPGHPSSTSPSPPYAGDPTALCRPSIQASSLDTAPPAPSTQTKWPAPPPTTRRG